VNPIERAAAIGPDLTSATMLAGSSSTTVFARKTALDRLRIALAQAELAYPDERNAAQAVAVGLHGVRHNSNLSCQIDLSAIIAVTDLISPTTHPHRYPASCMAPRKRSAGLPTPL
jgi:hypothetical protein